MSNGVKDLGRMSASDTSLNTDYRKHEIQKTVGCSWLGGRITDRDYSVPHCPTPIRAISIPQHIMT